MTTCESCGCMGDFHALGCPALQSDERDQRIRDAERAVLAAAEALEAAHVALNVATHRDTKRNLVAKRDRLTLALFAAVSALHEARKEVKG